MLSPMVWAARLSTSLAGFLVVFSALGAGTYWIFSAKQKVEDAFLLNTASDANRVEFTVPDASLVGLTVSEIHNLFSAYGPEGRKAFLHMALLDLFMYEVLYWLGLTISLAAVLRWNGCYIPFDESFSHSHSSAELHRHLGNHSHSHGPSIYSAVLHRSGGSSLSLPHSHSHGDLSFLSASGLHSVDHEGLTPNSGKNQRRIGGVPHSPDAVPHSRTGHAHDDHSLQDHIADPLAQSSTTPSPKPITVASQKLHGHSHSHGPGQPVHTHWHIHKGRDVGDHSHAHAHSHGAGQPIHTHTHSHGPIESSGDWQWRLLYGPLMTVVFDTMENICNYYLCYTFPSGWIPVVASWGSICTQLKYLFLFLSLTAIPFLVIRAILKPSSKGKSATD